MSSPVFAQPVPTSGPLSAAAATSTSVATSSSIASAAENAPGAITGYLTASRSTSLVDFQDGTRTDTMDYELKTSFQLTTNYSLDIGGSYSQDLHDSMKSDFDDSVITGNRRAIEIGKYLMLGESASVIIPTSKDSHTRQNMLMGARIGVGFGLNPVINPNLIVGVSLKAGENFHSYDTSLDGKALTKYAFSQALSLGYAMGRFSLSGAFIHKNGWTYQGQLQEEFKHTEELGFEINKHFAIAAGHTNGGSVFKANAQDSNIELINENSSLVYGSLTYLF